jgi:hypothetical protein
VLSTMTSIHGTHAQRLSTNQTQTIRNTILQNLGKEANLRVLENGKGAFLPIGKDTLFNIHGLRYVFKLKGDSAIRLDKSVYHGSNFNRYLFAHDGKMMALGGYGMFITNNNLEAFNTKTKEWYLIKTYGDVPNYILGAGLKFGNDVYILNNSINGDDLHEHVADPYFYRLDLNTMTWSRYREFRQTLRHFLPRDFFYLKDFVIATGQHQSVVYNLKTTEYILADNDALGLKQFIGYNTNVYENTLEIWLLDSNQTLAKVPQRNIDALWQEHKKLAKPLELNPNLLQQYPYHFLGLSTSAIILLLVYILIRRHQKRKKQQQHFHPLVHKILSHHLLHLDQDQLDQLLDIAHMEGESKKTKRHRLLTLIDGQYPGLIERQKDSTDKRRFLYYIHKNAE